MEIQLEGTCNSPSEKRQSLEEQWQWRWKGRLRGELWELRQTHLQVGILGPHSPTVGKQKKKQVFGGRQFWFRHFEFGVSAVHTDTNVQ